MLKAWKCATCLSSAMLSTFRCTLKYVTVLHSSVWDNES